MSAHGNKKPVVRLFIIQLQSFWIRQLLARKFYLEHGVHTGGLCVTIEKFSIVTMKITYYPID